MRGKKSQGWLSKSDLTDMKTPVSLTEMGNTAEETGLREEQQEPSFGLLN